MRIFIKTCEVWDTLFYDDCTPYDSTKWSNQFVSVSSDENGTTIAPTQNGSAWLVTSSPFSTYVAEIELKYQVQIFIQTAVDYFRINPTGANGGIVIPVDTWTKFKYVDDNETIKLYVFENGDWVLKQTLPSVTTNDKWGIYFYNGFSSNANATIKNVRIYPI